LTRRSKPRHPDQLLATNSNAAIDLEKDFIKMPIVTRRSFIKKCGTFRRRSLKAPKVTVDRVVASVQASLSVPEIADRDHIIGQAER
jgi:hypothetical protein